MSGSQIILYSIVLLIAGIYLRRFFMMRSLRHYSPAELSQLLKDRSNIILLDVRSNSERQQQQIKGSIHIPLHELSGRVKELEKYKDKEIVCYCLSGSRSMMAAAKLHKQGFNVSNLKGGISEWNFHHR